MFRYLLLATVIFASSVGITNYRPYVATRLAKAIMLNGTAPDNDVVAKCDGSGWITQGDGHLTRCPGCEACEGDGSIGQKPVAEPTSIDEPKQEPAIVKHDLLVYHMGANWCTPCNQMKNQTWNNKTLKKFMVDNGVKLSILDIDNPDHSKFFKYYKVVSLPTIIVLRSDDLNNPRQFMAGFMDHQSVQNILISELQ